MKRLLILFIVSCQFFFTAPPTTTWFFAADAPPRTKIRIATAAPSLSYFPIYAAVQKGFFATRGFDVEMIQMAASLTAAALLNRSVDYTIIPSTSHRRRRGAPGSSSCIMKANTLVVRNDVRATG
jgi:ABC-type nitrate/sulfonate/bicarbonate transport system substrate-binding protein